MIFSCALFRATVTIYMYLDEELIDIDHLYCFAHVQTKWKFWAKVAKARYFLLKVGNLYSREEEYLPPDEIRKRRNDAYTNGIVKDLWKRVYYLSLRWTTWFDVLWIIYICFGRVFQLQKSGEGMIDNLAVEGGIVPLTAQRKAVYSFAILKEH